MRYREKGSRGKEKILRIITLGRYLARKHALNQKEKLRSKAEDNAEARLAERSGNRQMKMQKSENSFKIVMVLNCKGKE